MAKCSWASSEPIATYHDNEHGKMPVSNTDLFELLTLEIFQPGLSFNIVLKKREGLRKFFHNYDLAKIAKMTEDDVLLGIENTDIIRHRLKIESVISNGKLVSEQDIDLTKYIFEHIDYRFGLDNVGKLLSKQMKKDGFRFVGPSVVTSLLEAIGLLPAHFDDCEANIFEANSFSYPTKFGALHISYDKFKIISSSIIHTAKCNDYQPVNTFEQFLIYHIDNYLNNSKENFKLLLDFKGTKFQCQVWDAIRNVPFGETRTYSDIAYTIGTGAFRAVGSAAAKSQFLVFLPVHRIVASSGIGGFQNQVDLKRELLAHEGIEYK